LHGALLLRIQTGQHIHNPIERIFNGGVAQKDQASTGMDDSVAES
jgi:hypothetical protein